MAHSSHILRGGSAESYTIGLIINGKQQPAMRLASIAVRTIPDGNMRCMAASVKLVTISGIYVIAFFEENHIFAQVKYTK